MLYVSTTLQIIESTIIDRDVLQDGTVYRRLDSEYYAWLRHRISLAQKAMEVGKIPQATFDTMRLRFITIHEWALEHHGRAELLDAIRNLNPKEYEIPNFDCVQVHQVQGEIRQPAEHRFPNDGDWAFTQSVLPNVVGLVDSIGDQAISLGWTESRLYQNRGRFWFPCGQDYGLVCFLDDDQTIGKVTRQSIEIIGPPPGRTILRFYNPDAEQPWIRSINPGVEEKTPESSELMS